MTDLPTIAMYWEGGPLSWIETLSILSFQRQGHKVDLYSTNKTLTDLVGVDILDPRDIVEFPQAVEKHALGAFKADIFRLYLQKKTDKVWMDSDNIALRPVAFQNGFLLPRSTGAINNAALRLPPECKTLNLILDHIEDPEKIPFWMNRPHQKKLASVPLDQRLLQAGKLMRISFGPRALTKVSEHTGEDAMAAAADVYSPVPWWLTDLLFCDRGSAFSWVTDNTQVVHVFASQIRGWHLKRMPAKGSLMRQQLDAVGYVPEGFDAG